MSGSHTPETPHPKDGGGNQAAQSGPGFLPPSAPQSDQPDWPPPQQPPAIPGRGDAPPPPEPQPPSPPSKRSWLPKILLGVAVALLAIGLYFLATRFLDLPGEEGTEDPTSEVTDEATSDPKEKGPRSTPMDPFTALEKESVDIEASMPGQMWPSKKYTDASEIEKVQFDGKVIGISDDHSTVVVQAAPGTAGKASLMAQSFDGDEVWSKNNLDRCLGSSEKYVYCQGKDKPGVVQVEIRNGNEVEFDDQIPSELAPRFHGLIDGDALLTSLGDKPRLHRVGGDGKVRWAADAPMQGDDPLMCVPSGKIIRCTTYKGERTALVDPDDGKTLWDFEHPEGTLSPLIACDAVFVEDEPKGNVSAYDFSGNELKGKEVRWWWIEPLAGHPGFRIPRGCAPLKDYERLAKNPEFQEHVVTLVDASGDMVLVEHGIPPRFNFVETGGAFQGHRTWSVAVEDGSGAVYRDSEDGFFVVKKDGDVAAETTFDGTNVALMNGIFTSTSSDSSTVYLPR